MSEQIFCDFIFEIVSYEVLVIFKMREEAV